MTTAVEYRDGKVVTMREFARENTAWTEASLRWLRFTGAENDADQFSVFLKQGRRVLIDKPAFWRWLKSQQRRAA